MTRSELWTLITQTDPVLADLLKQVCQPSKPELLKLKIDGVEVKVSNEV